MIKFKPVQRPEGYTAGLSPKMGETEWADAPLDAVAREVALPGVEQGDEWFATHPHIWPQDAYIKASESIADVVDSADPSRSLGNVVGTVYEAADRLGVTADGPIRQAVSYNAEKDAYEPDPESMAELFHASYRGLTDITGGSPAASFIEMGLPSVAVADQDWVERYDAAYAKYEAGDLAYANEAPDILGDKARQAVAAREAGASSVSKAGDTRTANEPDVTEGSQGDGPNLPF